MGFISKVELKKQLMAMGVNVEGNYVRKSDVEKVIAYQRKTSYTKNDEQRYTSFIKELTTISYKYGVILDCTGGVYAVEDPSDIRSIRYSNDLGSGDLVSTVTYKSDSERVGSGTGIV